MAVQLNLNSHFYQKNMIYKEKDTISERLYINSLKAEIPIKNYNGYIYYITSYIIKRIVLDVRNSNHIGTKIKVIERSENG
ncbi:hypothetical protein DCPSUM001_14810 [Dysgonomonas capnocytophagoides]|nr:hypothetical protein DCPSUM001_14810 [Dysgonomonas capnocytophagoides]